MTSKDLKALSDTQLVENFQRAVELDAENGGNGKSPFDKNQLKTELTERLGKKERTATNERSTICY